MMMMNVGCRSRYVRRMAGGILYLLFAVCPFHNAPATLRQRVRRWLWWWQQPSSLKPVWPSIWDAVPKGKGKAQTERGERGDRLSCFLLAGWTGNRRWWWWWWWCRRRRVHTCHASSRLPVCCGRKSAADDLPTSHVGLRDEEEKTQKRDQAAPPLANGYCSTLPIWPCCHFHLHCRGGAERQADTQDARTRGTAA